MAIMEPTTVLSVVSVLKAFVNFGVKLLSSARQPHKSSDDDDHSAVDVENLRSDLESLTQALQRKLSETELLSDPGAVSHHISEDDAALRKLLIQCIGIAKHFLTQLEKLISSPKDNKSKQRDEERAKTLERWKGSGAHGNIRSRGLQALLGADGSKIWEDSQSRIFSTWDSFQKAFMALWNNKEIEELAATLRGFRGEIEFWSLVLFRFDFLFFASPNSIASMVYLTGYFIVEFSKLRLYARQRRPSNECDLHNLS